MFSPTFRRRVAGFLIPFVAITSVLYPAREARAVGVLALLVEPALNVAARLVILNVGRQAVVTVGIAANESSWLVPLVSLTSRVAAILKIAGAVSSYEIPLQPGVAIPVPVGSPQVGELGTEGNPYPHNAQGLTYQYVSPYRDYNCVSSSWSKDGLNHSLPTNAVYNSFSDLSAACEVIRAQYAQTGAYKAPMRNVAYEEADPGGDPWGPNGPLAGSGVYVKSSWVCMGVNAAVYDAHLGRDYCMNAAVLMSLGMAERLDGVKRFVRTSDGFKPDPVDPDWTEAEKTSFSTGKEVQFKTEGAVVNVAATNQLTSIKSASQSGTNVVYREAQLTEAAVPNYVTEQVLPNANAEQVIASAPGVSPGTNPGTGTGTVVFPTDYARQGEAVSAATGIVNAINAGLDASPLSGADGGAPGKFAAADKSMGDREKMLGDLPGDDSKKPKIENWVPDLKPGPRVTCKALVFDQRITHGPAAGLGGAYELNICDQLEIVREIMGWLVSMGTIWYCWYTFTRGNARGVSV